MMLVVVAGGSGVGGALGMAGGRAEGPRAAHARGGAAEQVQGWGGHGWFGLELFVIIKRKYMGYIHMYIYIYIIYTYVCGFTMYLDYDMLT